MTSASCEPGPAVALVAFAARRFAQTIADPDRAAHHSTHAFTSSIAVCVGNCIGGGAELVAGCDLRIRGDNLKLENACRHATMARWAQRSQLGVDVLDHGERDRDLPLACGQDVKVSELLVSVAAV
jgi:hypothetical protein